MWHSTSSILIFAGFLFLGLALCFFVVPFVLQRLSVFRHHDTNHALMYTLTLTAFVYMWGLTVYDLHV